ncbi:MAG: 2-C-methyl-D-erythritol 4-phosphate cytidylyltransferase [Puniceicoccales bacterium]|nr:2-C-methyl-D-erythritol 4-phosphate cytidylyltransferase [Puniceicoccales bacterium]
MKTYAILLAAGIGARVGGELPKQFLRISGKTILEHSIEVFGRSALIDGIIVVAHADFVAMCEDICKKILPKKILRILVGGDTRQESSRIGIESIEDLEAKVLVHDAVRPLLTGDVIDACVTALDTWDAVDVAIPTADTIIRVDGDMTIADIPDRKSLMRGQTPQAFKLSVIRKAHRLASGVGNCTFTDDCGLVKMFSVAKIHVIEGNDCNIKITYPIDVFIADKLFQLRQFHATGADLSKLNGRVLVIFGASGGIGGSMAKIAREHGAKVYGFSRADGVDIGKSSHVKMALASVCENERRIDYAVNAAGILKKGNICHMSDSDIGEEIATNYVGCINVARGAYDYLKRSRGALLFFASSSYTRGRASFGVYSSTKAAVVNLTQAIAEEWVSDGIRVNAVNPERTATSMRLLNFGEEDPESLASPEFVAEKSLCTLLQDYSGQVVDIKRSVSV